MRRQASGKCCTLLRASRHRPGRSARRTAPRSVGRVATPPGGGMVDVLQSLADGLLFGAIYSLIGLGFTLVFGVMHKINMAYAAASLAGAYAGLTLIKLAGLSPWLVIPAACVAGAAFGIVIFGACFKLIPLSHPPATFMSTVGMLVLIDEIAVHATDG